MDGADLEENQADIDVQKRNERLYQGKNGDKVQEEEAESDGKIVHDEVRKPVIMRTPRQPTKEEVDTHNITHIPYRDWCPFCVLGCGCNRHHAKVGGEAAMRDTCPNIAFDYWFLNDEDRKQEQNPLIMMKDSNTEAMWAVPCGKKGSVGQEWVMKVLNNELESWGHANNKVIFKSDQEFSIVDFKAKLAGYRLGETSLEESPKGESESNGVVENSIRIIKNRIRVLKCELEHHIQYKIPADKDVLQWLIQWACTSYN